MNQSNQNEANPKNLTQSQENPIVREGKEQGGVSSTPESAGEKTINDSQTSSSDEVVALVKFSNKTDKKSANNQENKAQNSPRDRSREMLWRGNFLAPQYQKLSVWSLKDKVTAWAFAVSILPLLIIGTASYIAGHSIDKQIKQAREAEAAKSSEIWLERQLPLLVIGTGISVAAIAAFISNRALSPVTNAAKTSSNLLKPLLSEDLETSQDELTTLVGNLNLLKQKLPEFIAQKERENENFQVLMTIIERLQQARSQEEVFINVVEETRRLLRTERVAILRLDSIHQGTIIEESVAPRLPKILWSTVENPFLEPEYFEGYRQGMVRALDDIYQGNLEERSLNLLQRFGVKSSLVAPITKNKELFGLLIAHQCSYIRHWQKREIDLLSQIAAQVDLALKQTKILEKSDAKAEQAQKFIDLAHQIRESLNEEDVLNTTVREVRKAMRADRVVVYSFNPNGSSYIAAEAVLPGWPRALNRKIEDPCIPQELLEAYSKGRVVPTNNVFAANFHPDHVQLMKQLEIKANLVAPILKNGHLFGLLIAHQCSRIRTWQQAEIDFLSQIATQVGFTLDNARLVSRLEAEVTRIQILEKISRSIWASLEEENIYQTTVEEVRKALDTDRVIVYSFDRNWSGTVVAESVVANFPKTLRAEIKDPCFAERYVKQYAAGRVQAIENIYQAGLTDCHIKQLEAFSVKANLVAPIIKDDLLFGLLIAHQCSQPRHWHKSEINFFTQIALQVGLALSRARLIKEIEAESQQSKLMIDISRQIRKSLQADNVLKTAVVEIRKVLDADRVIVYSFDENWYGTVVAESVVLGFPKALWANIKDPCFAENYVDKYLAGRVQATDNIYEAGLTQCHLQQLEPFAVKANLVAPIIKDERLFGLLIAHQCSAPRHWQQWEINFLTQIALQVGFALEHCRLLEQTEQAYERAETFAQEKNQEKEVLLNQVSTLLAESEAAVANLANKTDSQQEAINTLQEQLQTLGAVSQTMTNTAEQVEQETEQWQQIVVTSQETLQKILKQQVFLHNSLVAMGKKLKNMEEACQQLFQFKEQIKDTISQIKFQGMNGVLEAARSQSASPELAAIAQQIHSLAQHLEENFSSFDSLLASLDKQTQQLNAFITKETEQENKNIQLKQETQQQLKQITNVTVQMRSLVANLTQEAVEQLATLNYVRESFAEKENLINEVTYQSASISDSFKQLKTIVQQLNNKQ